MEEGGATPHRNIAILILAHPPHHRFILFFGPLASLLAKVSPRLTQSKHLATRNGAVTVDVELFIDIAEGIEPPLAFLLAVTLIFRPLCLHQSPRLKKLGNNSIFFPFQLLVFLLLFLQKLPPRRINIAPPLSSLFKRSCPRRFLSFRRRRLRREIRCCCEVSSYQCLFLVLGVMVLRSLDSRIDTHGARSLHASRCSIA